jgi:tRNA 2-thiouridine synthesizing protein A
MAESNEIVVDARGHRCPVPTLRLQRALETAAPGETVRLLADDPIARIDVPHFLAAKGYRLIESSTEGGTLSFLVAKPSGPFAPPGS